MTYLFQKVDRYIARVKWYDFAFLKMCLFSLGVLAGFAVPKKHKKIVGIACLATFIASYVPLMAKFVPTLLEKE